MSEHGNSKLKVGGALKYTKGGWSSQVGRATKGGWSSQVGRVTKGGWSSQVGRVTIGGWSSQVGRATIGGWRSVSRCSQQGYAHMHAPAQ